MTEQILTTKKTGMAMLLLTILLYVVAIAALDLSIQFELLVPMILAIVVLALGWILLPGLKVLRPQEALVLTLFGKYMGGYPPRMGITWDDLMNLCKAMKDAGYSNPLGITLCDASIESLQFTWLLRVYGDYYYRQFYEYIMAGEVGSSWTDFDPSARVPEAAPTYGVQWAKLLNIMLDKDCSFGKGYAGMTSEVYLDFVSNLYKMKRITMNGLKTLVIKKR